MKKPKLLTIAVVGLLLLNLGMITMFLFKGKPPRHEDGKQGEGPKKIIIERCFIRRFTNIDRPICIYI